MTNRPSPPDCGLRRMRTDTLYRIHGTNEPSSIGKAVSNGCIRMLNDHVIDLYDRVGVGAEVVVR
nr:L,D-transpeptidase [Jiella pacifica]